MEYRVISESTMQDLVREVNNAVKERWRPQGGVSLVVKRYIPVLWPPIIWAQAMVRESK